MLTPLKKIYIKTYSYFTVVLFSKMFSNLKKVWAEITILSIKYNYVFVIAILLSLEI
jgi:hypothetical protein